jgi:putative copper export protein
MSSETAAVVLAGCRWLIYAAVLGLTGIAGARLVLRRVTDGLGSLDHASLERALTRTTNRFALLWIVALLLTLGTTIVTWFGSSGLTDVERIRTMLLDTRWGNSWAIAFAAACVASGWLVVARRRAIVRPSPLLIAILAAVIPTPLIGHAAGYGNTVWVLHAGHLLGTGLWLGTVFVVVTHTWRLWSDPEGTPTLRQMLAAISPLALTGAAMAVGSGVWMSAVHVWPPQTLLESAYGATLAAKISVVVLIAALGWLNWRRFGPYVDRPDARRRLRRSVVVELTLGLGVVLILTAWLSGLEAPM